MQIQQYTGNKNHMVHSNRGILDGAITTTLRTLDTNPMVNAVGIDLFAMVGPRTYVDTKERNKYAGAETFFREFTGTFIVCLSASYLAKGIAHFANKIIQPKTPINPNSWFSNGSIDLLRESWAEADNNVGRYVNNVLDGVSGSDGRGMNRFDKIDWDNVEWTDEKRWSRIKWDDKKYRGVHDGIKSRGAFVSAIEGLITDKGVTKKDRENLLSILETRFTNALGAGNLTVHSATKKLSTNAGNLLRDVVDMGRDVFGNSGVNSEKAIEKLLKINRVKSVGALAIASGLGLMNQYVNRKITEKRTGKKGFVGDTDYQSKISDGKSDGKKGLMAQKLLASVGMIAMAAAVMKIKSPKDFVKKLEFTGPVTSGNAIKTVYASTLVGRFMASDSKDELRETATRDYFGFLNWLVLGGFAAKGTANLLDKNRANLFNESKSGKGLRHWLNDVSLKSHNEIAAKGVKFAKKNMWKLNLSHIVGLGYSTLALGFLLPKLNILITNHKQNKRGSAVAPKRFDVVRFDEFKERALAGDSLLSGKLADVTK